MKEKIIEQFKNELRGKGLNEQGQIWFQYASKYPEFRDEINYVMNHQEDDEKEESGFYLN